ncbi:MAG: sorbosone dehydrogenase family protein [Beijerinckiaceae bacterium]
MARHRNPVWCVVLALPGLLAGPAAAAEVLRGAAAFGDWSKDAPGVRRIITPTDLPKPNATRSASNSSSIVRRPRGAVPKAPEGFYVSLFGQGFDGPRSLRVAPNGDVFLAESSSGQIRIARPSGDLRKRQRFSVFAKGLDNVYGLALWPPGPKPRYLYAAVPSGIVRMAYMPGTTRAGKIEWIYRGFASGGHWTRDIAFSQDGKRLFAAVGSLSNIAIGMGKRPDDLAQWERARAAGAAWGNEEGRAAVLVFDADGKNRRYYATGLRNCSGLTMQPGTDTPWCAVNERDGLGDDLPPDYATAVRENGFYGWPWYYIGSSPDPRHPGARPDLAGKATVPDVLFQAHSAPLGITFYTGKAFPEAYRGSAFVALHGSWNRSKLTGYKIVRLLFEDGKPTGSYEDFLTGFVTPDGGVWGRPTGVAMLRDGSLIVSEDGSDTIWRVAFRKKQP